MLVLANIHRAVGVKAVPQFSNGGGTQALTAKPQEG